MAYEPKTWACGDTITADDLNHIEQGVANAGGVFIADVKAVQNGSDWTCETDTTFEDIENAYNSGKAVFIRLTEAPTGYPEAYWNRFTLTMTAHVKGINFVFGGYNSAISATHRVSLAVDFNHTWSYVDNVSN